MSDTNSAFRLLLQGAEAWVERQKAEAFDLMQDVALEGESAAKEQLFAATTAWGQARVAGEVSGPKGTPTPREHAGRFERGDMHDDITSVAEYVGKDVIEARWGWEDPEDYYLYQEHGTDRIAPMEALSTSLVKAEDYLKAGLDKIGD